MERTLTLRIDVNTIEVVGLDVRCRVDIYIAIDGEHHISTFVSSKSNHSLFLLFLMIIGVARNHVASLHVFVLAHWDGVHR